MTKLSQLKNRIAGLAEVKDIIGAMKNLSLMETNKVTKYVIHQNESLKMLQNIAADFLTFNPTIKEKLVLKKPELFILLGSERGFCSNYNETILQYWQRYTAETNVTDATIIVIGNKLATKFATEFPVYTVLTKLNGANVAEEIPAVILSLLTELANSLVAKKSSFNPEAWAIVWNDEANGGIATKLLRPLQDFGTIKTVSYADPPFLYLTPELFFGDFINHYIFVILQQVFLQAFLSENKQRLKHMDAALDWIGNKNDSLLHRLGQIRQEEITEEIEVVMLSAKTILTKKREKSAQLT